MNRMVSIILSALLFTVSGFAADRTLAAEGDYVAVVRNGSKPLGHWKLWRLPGGDYEVVENLAKPAHVEQVFRFNAQFLPSGFSLTIGPDSRQIPRGQETPIDVYPTIISCQFDAENLKCQTENNGKKSATTIPVKQPYVFVFGEFYALDYAWFLTGVVRLAENSHAKDDVVNVYVMADDRVHADQPVKLAYAGDENTQALGKAQAAREYQGQLGSEREPWRLGQFSLLRVNSLGLVVSVKSDLGHFAVSNYKEYEPLAPAH